jgi:hypothetical protein
VWGTLIRVRNAVGDYDGVVSTFALCQRPLRAAEIAPAAATRALLDQLRRGTPVSAHSRPDADTD